MAEMNEQENTIDTEEEVVYNDTNEQMTEEEYRALLRERGNEKLEEHQEYVDFYGTVIVRSNNLFNLGEDYNLGDYVTIVDDNLNMAADLQLIGITKSLTSDGEITDFQFGRRKMTLYKRVRKRGNFYG